MESFIIVSIKLSIAVFCFQQWIKSHCLASHIIETLPQQPHAEEHREETLTSAAENYSRLKNPNFRELHRAKVQEGIP